MALLDDDETVFQAALSFVDEFSCDEDAAGRPSCVTDNSVRLHGPTTPVVFSPDAHKQRRRDQINEKRRLLRKAGVYGDPNRVRNAGRLELLQLREQLEQLQVDVQVLTRMETKERPRSLISSPSLGPSAWQELALRQRRRREDAERDNIRLKVAVEHQRQIAEGLRDLMQKRTRQVTKECTSLTSRPSLTHHDVNLLDVNGDMEDFRVLFRHLENAYQAVDTLFTANGLAAMSLPPGDVHMRENVDGRYLECCSHKLLPFAMRMAAEATWEHFKGVEKHFGNGSLYEKTAKDLDDPYTIIENFTKELYSDTSRADIQVKQVVRRYVETDRDVVIWVARVAPAEIKHKMLRGLAYHLRGYAVTRKSPESRPTEEQSVLQQCSLVSLDQDATMRCNPADLRTLTNFMMCFMAFLQDDDDAFEAALALLDEFAAGVAVDGGSSSVTTSSSSLDPMNGAIYVPDARPELTKKQGLSDEKEKRKAAFNEKRKLLRRAGVYGDANRARNERSREIAHLREQMGKLQVDLQILQTRQSQQQDEGKEMSTTVPSTESQISSSLWKGVADQQRRRRQEAERDNVLLRLAVERQRNVANSLTSIMHRRAAQLTNECASLVTTACPTHQAVNVLDFSGDMEDFRGLFRRLDDAYQKMDDIFMASGLMAMAIPPGDVHVHRGLDGKSLEFVSYKVLPFDVRATAEATWNHFKGVEKHLINGSLYEKSEKDLDEPYTIIADFKKEVYSASSRADIKVKQVIRRYVEQDRDLVLWVSRAVPIEIKHKMLRGLTYHLRGFAVSRRSSESTPDREVSVLQLCYLVSLDQDAAMRCDPTNLHELLNFLVATTMQNIRAHQCTSAWQMAFLQEDDGAFEAALSLLDEFASDTAAAEAEPSSTATPAASCKPKTRGSRGRQVRGEEEKRRKAELNKRRKQLRKAGVYGDANKARNERSREIAFLREQMERLQLDLEVLQSPKGEKPRVLVKKAGVQVTGGLWQQLACQQKRRREETERDNVLLRLAIERQKKVAGGLRSLMQRRATQLTNECSSLMTLVCSKHHVVEVLDLRGDLGDFQELFGRLDDSYRKVNEVFMANGLAGMTVSPLDLHVREGVDGNYFELSSYKVLPFDVRAATEAAWNHFKGVEKHLGNGSLYEKAEKFEGLQQQDLDEPYTIIADFKKEIYSASSRADIQVKQVIRRYVEEDRDVIVWVSHAIPIEIKNKKLRGLTYHLRGYAITKRSADSTPDRELTVLQLCYMISLDQEAESRYGHDDVRAITNFMIVSAGQNLRAHREFIENALVDQVLAAGNTTQ
uniref:M96 mating-specific protein family n=1 Tax=Phytophthora ramorum TaxID=164328 RepID=H3GNN3_PHYRM